MSFVTVVPEVLATSATDLASIGDALQSLPTKKTAGLLKACKKLRIIQQYI